MPLTALLLALSTPSLAETHAPDAVIENAVYVDIPPQGFEAIAAAAVGLVPTSLPIDDVSDEGGTWCFNYAFSLSGAWVAFEVVDTVITPEDGYLDLTITLNVQVNDASDPFALYTELACIGDTCEGYVKPFPVTLHTTLALDVVRGSDGNPTLDATVGTLDLTYDLDTTSDIDLGDCGISTLDEILGFFGLDLYGFVVDLVDSQLESALADVGPQIETAIEDAFGSVLIDQDVDLNGTTLHVSLYPSDVQIDPSGVRLAMNGGLSSDAASDCIAEFDPGGSLATPSDPPDIGSAPDGVDSDYHLGALISDDFANQGLYSLWRGGLLCYTLGDELGIPLDTGTVLTLLAGDAFDELFPEPAPIGIQTRPRQPPLLDLTGEHDLNVAVDELGLEIYADVDGRKAQVLGLDLGVDAGVDLSLDGSTGDLGLGIDLGTDTMSCTVRSNEFEPEANAEIESQCAGALGSLAGTVLSGLLGDLAFALPSFSNMGVTDLEVAATGPSNDWLGLYAWIGEVSYGSGDTSLGCGGTDTGSGTSSSGCSGGGCSTGGRSTSRWALLAIPLALAALRRRR